MLKIVLLAYSQGLISSRSIAAACTRNVQFIALSGDSQPSTPMSRWARSRLSAIFSPPPEQLAFRQEGVKVTLVLSKKSVELFKSEAAKHNTQYQRMIRRLVDLRHSACFPVSANRPQTGSRVTFAQAESGLQDEAGPAVLKTEQSRQEKERQSCVSTNQGLSRLV
ncbi:hypothetical protein HNP55_002827 [Paucibacter oligotrophus]|uniref:Transposase InsH N-terminal domain-containing protein n=1 Tax=Roseateles oligotrophus TaxID=1769250 RepID=A0A840L955_9BURK|nr:transposase [Roseateles oligotrophus]MBB4844291.1 hypothetical protein [Roseateles oligotrophus]